MIHIQTDEIEFHPSSLVDLNGRLFEWQSRLYRAIGAKHANFYHHLFTIGAIDRLVRNGFLVDTELTAYVLDGYELILQHRKLPFVSYPYEWTGTMLKDAALFFLNFNLELAALGLTTQDAHPWNILFEGHKPLFVDIGSIVSVENSDLWINGDEFHRFFLRPLNLFSMKEHKSARWLLHDYRGVTENDLAHIGPPTFTRAAGELKKDMFELKKDMLTNVKRLIKKRTLPHKVAKKMRYYLQSKNPMSIGNGASLTNRLSQLKSQVEDINIPIEQTAWSNYYLQKGQTSFPSFQDNAEWTEKHKYVTETLLELKPTTVLDIASNRGWFSQMAARLGSKVVAFDNDESTISILYQEAKGHGLSVLPTVMDILKPSPGNGWFGRGWAMPATERFRCELVLALAVVHHLVFNSSINMTFAQIVRLLSTFSSRWLLVEFVPREDQYVSLWYNDNFSWYTLNNFIRTLETEFLVVRQMNSHPSPRVLLLCQRK